MVLCFFDHWTLREPKSVGLEGAGSRSEIDLINQWVGASRFTLLDMTRLFWSESR